MDHDSNQRNQINIMPSTLQEPEQAVVPRKMSATDSHYEALRKAYDQRVQSLSKKLRRPHSVGICLQLTSHNPGERL